MTYDAANYGYDLEIPLVDPRLTGVQTFTYSATATVHRTNVHSFTPSGTTAVSYTPLLHSTDPLFTDLDTGLIAHEANNTAFDQDYLIEAPTSAVVHQIQISAAFILNVSAWVDGTLALTGVQFQLASYQSAASPLLPPYSFRLAPSSAFTALAAAGAHLFIVRDFIDIPFEIQRAGPVTLNIQILTSGTAGTDTFQVGIVDMYPVHKSTAAKRMFPSELIAHILPTPQNADIAMKFGNFGEST